MIVFDIVRRKPRPTVVEHLPVVRKTIFQQIAECKQPPLPPAKTNREVLERVMAEVPDYDPAKQSLLPNGVVITTPPEVPGCHPIGMGKIEYARWLSVYVYPKFHKGSLVTLASLPFVPGEPPKVVFRVTSIQELHYSAQFDKQTRQPKCVGISNAMLQTDTFPIYYPPSLLRALQPEEVQAIDRLRNQTSDGRESEATGLDGSESSADRSTGESS